MSRVIRAAVMTGLAAAAGLAITAGPAAAAPAGDASGAAGDRSDAGLGWYNPQVAGFYNTSAQCRRVGTNGNQRYWYSYQCAPVRAGLRAGSYVLNVYPRGWASWSGSGSLGYRPGLGVIGSGLLASGYLTSSYYGGYAASFAAAFSGAGRSYYYWY
ncbi:hypothetical protein [Actinoplanes sp. NPDC051851]|uniref:hypothetical protein n=1 Tax=Actinoplanes sp. NPDC051851 TaxID=3154753 RepID=UPI0034153C8D